MLIKDVVQYLDDVFHPEYQEEYDNAGFLVGNQDCTCQGVLVALDVTPAVIDECIDNHCNMIVTHHPLIFRGVKRITTANLTGRMLYKLIQNNIAVYAAHTNLDNLSQGVNGILSQRLGLTQCRILSPAFGREDVGAGMVGELPVPMPFESFVLFVKRTLNIPCLRISAPCRQQISRVAICGGAGGFLLSDAITANADIFITSDLKYHDFQQAEERIILVDAGHFETEQFAKEVIFSAISEKFSTFVCRISTAMNSYVFYL